MNCPHIKGHHCLHAACPGKADAPVAFGLRKLPNGVAHCLATARVNVGAPRDAGLAEVRRALAANPLPEPERYEPVPLVRRHAVDDHAPAADVPA